MRLGWKTGLGDGPFLGQGKAVAAFGAQRGGWRMRVERHFLVAMLAFLLLVGCKRQTQPENSAMASQAKSPTPVLDDISDDEFFQGRDFHDVLEELSSDPLSNRVVIGGAKNWDPTKWPDYSLLVGMKVKESEIKFFHPYTHGHVLVLNRESGELFVTKAWEPNKMELPSSPEDLDSMEALFANDTRITTTLDWVRLPGNLAQVPPSKLEIRFLTGGDLVGPVVVSTGTTGLRWQSQEVWKAARVAPTPVDLADPRFQPRPGQVCPADPGVSLVADPAVFPPNRGQVRWGVSGRICLEESSLPSDLEWVDVHLVFAWKGSQYVGQQDLRIPKRAFRKDNGRLGVDFSADLYPVFEERKGVVAPVPEGLLATVVCASRFFGPYPLDLGVFRTSSR